jgi:hypothetical protein
MSVFLGQDGLVQIKRTADASGFIALVKPSDVNTTRHRFSYDYVGELGGGIGQELIDPDQTDTPDNRDEMQYVPLITGDRVRFQRVAKDSNGNWVNSTADQQLVEKPNGNFDTDFSAYVNVDGLGGIRLYKTFEDAVNFVQDNAYDLQALTEDHYFKVMAGQLDQFRGLAKVQNYEFTTSRESIDITQLGANFRRFYSNGLLAGQGSMECLWPLDKCGLAQSSGDCDSVRYLAELILRLEEGAVFSGNFIINYNANNRKNENRFLYYECDKCVITSVAVTVDPSSVLRTTINFVTSGPFQLRYSTLPAFILLESITKADNVLLQEDDGELAILDDDLLD